MTSAPTILWFRHDLRLSDNPALIEAMARGAVVPLYIHEDAAGGARAADWWLHQGLEDLGRSLREFGATLVLRCGEPLAVLRALVAETGADTVCWNRCYDPSAITRDKTIKQALQEDGIVVSSHNASLLFEPWRIKTGADAPYKVFTPFSKACLKAPTPPAPLAAPQRISAVAEVASEALGDWGLCPVRPDWAGGLRETWPVGEAAGQERLHDFLTTTLRGYREGRDRPDREATSRLSPYLRGGQIGPRQVWHATQHVMVVRPEVASDAEVFLRELLWREFSYHLLFHFPDLSHKPLNARFGDVAWRQDSEALRAWQRGLTGYPIVDAGMRQLWRTGWMHNRVRMVAASFLVKDLLLPWQEGAAWFMDTLVDADPASNAASWQWVAGCGADAAPFFRIFNPVLQGKKFDPLGDYVRFYVPELARLGPEWIHEPWKAPAAALAAAGVVLGQNYPRPIVDHGAARVRALAALGYSGKT